MNAKRWAIRSAVAATVALAVFTPTAANAAVSGWLHGVADWAKPSGCQITGYDASDRAVVWEVDNPCAGNVGVQGRYTSGGYTYYTAMAADPVIATVNHSNMNAYRMSNA